MCPKRRTLFDFQVVSWKQGTLLSHPVPRHYQRKVLPSPRGSVTSVPSQLLLAAAINPTPRHKHSFYKNILPSLPPHTPQKNVKSGQGSHGTVIAQCDGWSDMGT